MADIYSEEAENILRLSFDRADAESKSLRQYWGGTPYGHGELTDLEYVAWFEKKMSVNPNWAPALSFVDGGPHELRRYMQAKVRLTQMMTEAMYL